MQGVQPPCNSGQRLIVVNAGSRSGFVKGAQLIYKANSSTGDYHREMNGQNFRKWLEEMLLPNLTSPCAIVMDNASYHSMQTRKCPTSSSKKAEMQDWLISFKDDMVNARLIEMVRLYKPAPSYVIDDVVRRNGHEVLRLPPYHPEFNAIELIWSQLKSIVRHRNFTFRLDDTLYITAAAFDEIGEERWRNACEHVDKVIETTKGCDNYMGEIENRVVINLADDDSSTDSASMGSTTDTASEAERILISHCIVTLLYNAD